MKDEYSTLEICKALKIGRERLRDWQNRDYIQPSIQKASGHGKKALFSQSDVHLIALFKRLVENGFNREVAAQYIKEFQARPGAEETSYILFRQEKGEIDPISFARGDYKLEMTVMYPESMSRIPEGMGPFRDGKGSAEWELALIVNFETLKKEVDTALAELS